MDGKIKDFTDLLVWKEGHKLVLLIYKTTSNFPGKETYALVDQMRRAVISVTSNIAEGFSRDSFKDKLRFYVMAKGSATELHNQLIVARDVGYLKKETFNEAYEQLVLTGRLLTGLIRATRQRS